MSDIRARGAERFGGYPNDAFVQGNNDLRGHRRLVDLVGVVKLVPFGKLLCLLRLKLAEDRLRIHRLRNLKSSARNKETKRT